MVDLLNAIIARGGTTAMTQTISPKVLVDWMAENDGQSAWHVAVDGAEAVMGFQWIAPDPRLPPEAADIATFVRLGQNGHGIGSRLFEATRKAAKRAGYKWINATIRADNEGGLIYYQSRGFVPYGRMEGVCLEDGQTVDKIHKRFDL